MGGQSPTGDVELARRLVGVGAFRLRNDHSPVIVVTLAAAALAGVLALFGLLHPHEPAVRRLYAAIGAGAIGAIVSVLMRMSGMGRNEFTIDHELGSGGVRRLGALRPLIGAVCGAVITLLVQTTLVTGQHGATTTTFVIVVAFLAGFSERWTKVLLEGAMRTVEAPQDGSANETQNPTPQSATPCLAS